MRDFEKSNNENSRRQRLGAAAAAGLLALTGVTEVTKPASAAPQKETSVTIAEKVKNPMISRIDKRMVSMVRQLKSLGKAHKGAVRIVRGGVVNGEHVTDYMVTMQVKNLQGENSYTVLDIITPEGQDLPEYCVFVPNSPTPAPDISATPKPPNMLDIYRFRNPDEYVLDSYNPYGGLFGRIPIVDSVIMNKSEVKAVNNVYDDLTGLIQGFIETKAASYKPSA